MDWGDPILQLCREGATLIPALDPYGGFLKWGTPNGWFISGKIPSRNGWFRATPIYGTPHIWKRFLCRLEDRKTLNPRLEVEHWPSQIGQILRPRSLGAAHIRRQFLVSRVSFWRQENMDAFRVLGQPWHLLWPLAINSIANDWDDLRWFLVLWQMHHAMLTLSLQRMPCGGVALGFGKLVDFASVLVIWNYCNKDSKACQNTIDQFLGIYSTLYQTLIRKQLGFSTFSNNSQITVTIYKK